jgi:Domain of unknown function (DUF1707)
MDTPGDKIAAGGGGRGHLRTSRADREQVIDALKAAFVQGMLAKDEFDLRVGQTLASRTYAELAALTADLPAGLTDARPLEAARESVNKKAVAAVACATAVLAGMIAAGSANSGLWFAGFIIVLLFAVPTGWLLLFHDWLDKRAGRRSARGLPPGAGGEPSQRPMSAGPPRQLPSAGRDLRHTAEAAQSRLPRPPLPTLRRPCRGHARGRGYAIG